MAVSPTATVAERDGLGQAAVRRDRHPNELAQQRRVLVPQLQDHGVRAFGKLDALRPGVGRTDEALGAVVHGAACQGTAVAS